jgi:hypothetical protein
LVYLEDKLTTAAVAALEIMALADIKHTVYLELQEVPAAGARAASLVLPAIQAALIPVVAAVADTIQALMCQGPADQE